MSNYIKNFCHMCGHYLNGLAKEILYSQEGKLLCFTCGKVGGAIAAAAFGVIGISTIYDFTRGTRCKNGIPNSWSAKTDYRRMRKHYYCLQGYSEEEAEARAYEDYP
jgi:hypothetical protein